MLTPVFLVSTCLLDPPLVPYNQTCDCGLYVSSKVHITSQANPLVHKESEELLNLLVDPLGLDVCLCVISDGGCHFDPSELAQTTHEFQHKLVSLVADHFFQ